jgi:hypothetical protein
MEEDRIRFNEVNIDENVKARIDTTVPKNVKEYIDKKNYKVNELIRLGILAKEDNPQLIQRIRDLENKYVRIENSLSVIIELLHRLDTNTALCK